MSLRAIYISTHQQTDVSPIEDVITADQSILPELLKIEDKIVKQELNQQAFSETNTIKDMLVLLANRGLVKRIYD